MTESQDAASVYDSKPWTKEYGVDAEFKLLPYKNLPELIRQVSQEYADNPAFSICLDNGLHAGLSFREVDELSDQFMAYLRAELGLQDGERVAIQMPNCLSYPITAFGILKANGVVVNVNPLYTASEMNKQLVDSGAKTLVIIDMFADKLNDALQGTEVRNIVTVSVANFFPTVKRTLIKTVLKLKKQIPKCEKPATDLADALAIGKKHLNAGKGKVSDNGNHDSLAALQYTGGTTGVAKGAELTHGNLLANIAQIDYINDDRTRPGKETVLTALPLYHIFAFTFNMLFFYRWGAHNVLSPSPRPVTNLKPCFEKFDITKFSGVNILFKGLLGEDWFRNNPPANLDITISGGTALHSAVAEEWKKVVGSEIFEGYGLSETSPVLACNPPKGEARTGTIGVPVPGTDVRIVDENDNPVPQGESGELIARGPQVMRGYANKPDENASALRGGWFRTGDVAVMDERGYFRIVDRKKDMIDVSGFNVFPNEVEDALSKHQDVVEVAVIGVPNDSGSETVRAYVTSSNPNLTAEEVIEFARQHLTAYKVPKEVVFKDELPKTPVGKILRKELRKEAEQNKAG
ncbi:long-chain-fatty-acid--CoA ligase [Alkalilimnicola ehrlichii]|uniref:Long-chain-fatty-acid--CoA ligase n=1 Tax=Alkalilimnicola ehrlichii TaxID=351052 RepID=A0A3E0X0M0_9GAMM|nr:AMP-binding protein [Alkalilimnicola ehrlichii]RFA31017.1 long-chain-fatty-acid--CoA ligase [Alkalilimnicola ehrlichii]RFA38970.1 long-chain-fatty-acid--CoA ligase [Alkalilimnicola ehrlichii]